MIPDFTRIIWHSEPAHSKWQGILNNINEAWSRIERWSVVEGARDSCLTFFEPQHLPELTRWAASHGLVVLPLAQVGIADQYSATPQPVVAGGRWQYRVVITRPALVADWLAAWEDTGQAGRYRGTNNQRIGQLLGFPQCCIDFFEREWVGQGSVDTTWAAARNTSPDSTSIIKLASTPFEANILLRWLGVRLVAHLPCSFTCEGTVEMARRFVAVGRKRHFGEWVDRIEEMLQWPVEWSALHGIAEIRTPVLTISARTNATGQKLAVQKEGTIYPDEGAQGLRFPFRIVKDKATGSPSFKRSVESTWQLNGFSTQEGMDQAHAALLSALPTTPGSFLDLGCGSGRLLERAKTLGWEVSGVESDHVRAGAATIPVRRGDLLDVALWNDEYSVIAVMPGRLLEGVAVDKAERFRQALTQRAGAVLLYAYGDWLKKYGGLGPLAAEAGLGGGAVLKVGSAPGVEAALVSFQPVSSLVPMGGSS